MELLTFGNLIAVFEKIFGRALFWALVAVADVVTLVYFYLLIRDRALSMRKFLMAHLSMPFGAVAAVVLVLTMNHSHLRDIGGQVDLILLLGVELTGATGAAILVYTAQSLIPRKQGVRGDAIRQRVGFPGPLLPYTAIAGGNWL